jgi:hypothetical protein
MRGSLTLTYNMNNDHIFEWETGIVKRRQGGFWEGAKEGEDGAAG